MDHRLAVHTLARRYCEEQHALWARKYFDLEGHRPHARHDYSPEAYDTFPRYLILEAILQAVEEIRPEAPEDVEPLVGLLSDAASTAATSSTLSLSNEIAISAMEDERQKFTNYIRNLSGEEIEAAEPLPHRRTLTAHERNDLWEALRSAWNVGGAYWHPHRIQTAAEGVLAFHTDYFDSSKVTFLATALAERGVRHVFELREGGQDGLELGLDLLQPFYNGLEGYWTSAGVDWLVYASHESAVTIAGDWLVNAFRAKFRECDNHQYGGPSRDVGFTERN